MQANDTDMNNDLDMPLFDDGNEEDLHHQATANMQAWKVLIVDDEPGVHEVTTLALKRFTFAGRGLQFFHAYSAEQGKSVVIEHDDIAVILLDVVMESDHAGLALVDTIREDLHNRLVRIILRTGQPGSAPEADVIERYDINDYKEKTELTKQKLSTAMYAALRAYRDIQALDYSRRGLERVIRSTASIMHMQSLEQFLSGLLMQMMSVLDLDQNAFFSQASGLIAHCHPEHGADSPIIMAGSGRFEAHCNESVKQVLSASQIQLLEKAIVTQGPSCEDGQCVFLIRDREDSCGLVFLEGCSEIDEVTQRFVELFCSNAGVVFENVHLYSEIEETQREIVYRLGTVAEFRSQETSQHVKRVGEYSYLLARHCGLSDTEAEQIKLASPLHDLGKIATPDRILNKCGSLTDDEMVIMHEHAQLGYDMLAGSDRPILNTAAEIAHTHHEQWNGEGYPRGLSGTDIPISGRIVAVADVFDALGSKRCYKQVWTLEEILSYFNEQRGRRFDPQLVDILMTHLDEFLAIRACFLDQES